jgi:hypothetical protein
MHDLATGQVEFYDDTAAFCRDDLVRLRAG